MKIIVFAEESVCRNYIPYLNGKGVKVSYASNHFEDILTEDTKPSFDLAMVDNGSAGAVEAYRYHNETWSIPIVLLIGNADQEWYEMSSFRPVGYISKKTGIKEFYARLMAIYRRVLVNCSCIEPVEDIEAAEPSAGLTYSYLNRVPYTGVPVNSDLIAVGSQNC